MSKSTILLLGASAKVMPFNMPTSGVRALASPKFTNVVVQGNRADYSVSWLEARSVKTLATDGSLQDTEVRMPREGRVRLFPMEGIIMCSGFGRSVKRMMEFLWPDADDRPNISQVYIDLNVLLSGNTHSTELRDVSIADLYVERVGPGVFDVQSAAPSSINRLVSGTKAWLSSAAIEIGPEPDSFLLTISRAGTLNVVGIPVRPNWPTVADLIEETLKKLSIWGQISNG